MRTGELILPEQQQPERDDGQGDDCQVCRGLRGGVKGNENRLDGVTVCDYCTATILRFEELRHHKQSISREVA